MKTKRVLSFIVALSMILTMVGNFAIFADDENTHKHAVCGATCDGNCVEGTHNDLIWTDLKDASDNYAFTENLSAGNYYLSEDVTITISNRCKITNDVKICLNGHTLTLDTNQALYVETGGKLSITDCSGEKSGKIVDTATASFESIGTEYGGSNNEINLYGGTYKKDKVEDSFVYGIFDIMSGCFNVYDANIEANVSNNLIALEQNGTANIYDGIFDTCGNTEVSCINADGEDVTLNVYGGTFKGGIPFMTRNSGVNLYGMPDIQSELPVQVSRYNDNDIIHIKKKLSASKPIKVSTGYQNDSYTYYKTKTFADGWNDYMSGEDPNDYFVCGNDSNYIVKLLDDGSLRYATQQTIETSYGSNVTLSSDKNKAYPGDTVVVTANVNQGYKLSNIKLQDVDEYYQEISDVEVTTVDNNDNTYTCTFEMPYRNIKVSAEVVLDDDTTYTITNESAGNENATIEIDKTEAGKDDEVTVTIKNIKTGYKLSYVMIEDEEEDEIETITNFTSDEDGSYKVTFTMPEKNVKVVTRILETNYTVKAFPKETKDGSTSLIEGDFEYKVTVDDSDYEVTNYSENDVKLYYTSNHGESATLTITKAPTGYKMPETTSVTFTVGDEFTGNDTFKCTYDADTMRYDVDVVFEKEEVQHVHPLCGAECDGSCVENTHDNVTWTELTRDIVDGYMSGDNATLPAGSYCLAEDITVSKTCEITGDVKLCLNGHKFSINEANQTLFNVKSGSLSVTDCSEEQTGELKNNSYYLVDVSSGATANIYAGNYNGNLCDFNVSGTINIYGGTMNCDGSSTGMGCVALYNGSVGNIYGGTLQFTGVYASGIFTNNGSVLNLYGGTIGGNRVISASGTVNLYGVPTLTNSGYIQLAKLEKGNIVHIKAAMTNETPIRISSGYLLYSNDDYQTCDFADGWNTYMSGKNPADYFSCENDSENYTAKADESGNLRFSTTYYNITINGNIANGKVEADKTEEVAYNDTITLTATPDDGYRLKSISVKDANDKDVEVTEVANSARAAENSKKYTFQMPRGNVSVTAEFEIDSDFTIKAVVNETTADRDTTKDGVQVNANDTIKVDVVVSGGDFTSAAWKLLYNPAQVEFVGSTKNAACEEKGIYTLNENNSAVLEGKLVANTGRTDGDEFANNTSVITYEFKAKAMTSNVTSSFVFEQAYANTYEIAGKDDFKPAKTENASVEIVLVEGTDNGGEEGGETQTPAGSIEKAEKTYNAKEQTGNPFVLEDGFEGATILYAAADGDTAKEELQYRSNLPSWKDVGTYTYYAKISGAGIKTTYVGTTLTIKPATLTPSARFEVDPKVSIFTFTPLLEGVFDGSHNGKVKVTYKSADASSVELDATDFDYRGDTTSEHSVIPVTMPESGEYSVTLEYIAGEDDNYIGGSNTVTIDVGKISAPESVETALKSAVKNSFVYDSEKHGVVIDTDAVESITLGKWKASTPVDAIDGTENPTVTNVGEDKLVKVVFTDIDGENSNGQYNDVVVYAVLKVTPAFVLITIEDSEKVAGMGDPSPLTTGKIQVVDEETKTPVMGEFNNNGLYGDDDFLIDFERASGEDIGVYDITATYVPTDNYTVLEVTPGKFTIKAPEAGDTDEIGNPLLEIEVVDLSKGGTEGDLTPDYIAGKRLVLVYTNIDKMYYGYGDSAETAEKLFDVTRAEYTYVDNDYDAGTYETDPAHGFTHVYGIVVDGIGEFEATEAHEKLYRDKIVFLGTDSKYKPEDIIYDADINLTETVDDNDFSMANGIYNNKYSRAEKIKSILKADINHDKKVDIADVADIKALVAEKNQ